MADPPARTAPPGASSRQQTSSAKWAECLVQYADRPASADAQEVWVFRLPDYEDFQRLIGLRLSYSPAEGAPARFGEDRREEAMTGTKVTCRERSKDPELICAECIRVFTGGAYKDKAISVPAYPAQPGVLGCLALSVGSAAGVAADNTSNPLHETAFCNIVNVRFSTVAEA